MDDGSSDGSWKVVQSLKEQYGDKVVGVSFARNQGKSAALHTGFKVVRGKVVITMDADLQDSPDEILELERRIVEEGFDLISGWKKKRHDPITKTVPTKLYNWATRRVSGIHLHDFNCGLKAYRREVVQAVEVNGEMHRYIPVLAKQAGFSKIGEQVVQHQARKYGTTKFGLERFVNGFLDLLTICILGQVRKQAHAPFWRAGYFDVCRRLCTFCRHWRLQIVGAVFSITGKEHCRYQCLLHCLVLHGDGVAVVSRRDSWASWSRAMRPAETSTRSRIPSERWQRRL